MAGNVFGVRRRVVAAAVSVALAVGAAAGVPVSAAASDISSAVVAENAPVVDPFFLDVLPSQPFYDDIQWMRSMGLSTGYVVTGGAEYHPAEDVSRQAMAAFLYRYSGEAFTPPRIASFKDVPVSHPFFTAIEWMKSVAITTGYADGTFHPLESVTRQAMAAFLARFAKVTIAAPASPSFTDVSTGSTFAAQIEWMKKTGITTGNADGSFHPVESVTRQAMAAFLHRYIKRPTDQSTLTYTIAPTTTEVDGGVVLAVDTTPSTSADTDGDEIPDTPDTSTDTVQLAADAAIPVIGAGFVVTPGTPGAESGLAGKVTAVTTNEDGSIAVSVGQAALDTIFTDLNVSYDEPVDLAGSTAGAVTPASGATVLSPAGVAASEAPDQVATLNAQATAAAAAKSPVSCTDSKGKAYTFSNENNLSVEVTFENVRSHYEVQLGSMFAKPYLNIYVYTEPVIALKLKSTLQLKCKVAMPAGVTVPLPPPVSAVTLTVKPYFEFSVSGSVAFSVQQRFYRMLGFYTKSDGSITTLKGGSADPVQFVASGGVKVTINAGAQIDLGVFDQVGLYLKIGPEIEFAAEAKTSNGGQLCLSATLSLGGSMGVFLDVWVKKWTYEFGKVAIELAKWEKCTPNTDLPNHSPPTITTISPSNISTNGAQVTITGTNLVDTALITIGGKPVVSISADSDTSVTAIAPKQPRGTYPVTVSTPYGTADGATLTYSDAVSPADPSRDVVVGWGYGTFGDGSSMSTYDTPTVLAPLSGAKSIVQAWGANYAVRSDGTVLSWGDNRSSKLGRSTPYYDTPTPGTVSLPRPVVSLTALGLGYCSSGCSDISIGTAYAILDDGSVWVWGNDEYGQYGATPAEDGYSPVNIPGLAGTVSIVEGGGSTIFAIKADGSLWSLSYGANGMNSDTSARFVKVPGLDHVVQLSDSGNYVLTADGAVWKKSSATTFEKVPSITGVASLTTSYANQALTFALGADGSVWTLVDDWMGGMPAVSHITEIPPITSIADDWGGFIVAVAADGSVWRWGSGSAALFGEVASNRPLVVSEPVRVEGLPAIDRVSLTGYSVIALARDGSAWTWGEASAVLGVIAPTAFDSSGPFDNRGNAIRPIRLTSVNNVMDLDVSSNRTYSGLRMVLARTAEGLLIGWGEFGSTVARTPMLIPGGTNVTSILSFGEATFLTQSP